MHPTQNRMCNRSACFLGKLLERESPAKTSVSPGGVMHNSIDFSHTQKKNTAILDIFSSEGGIEHFNIRGREQDESIHDLKSVLRRDFCSKFACSAALSPN